METINPTFSYLTNLEVMQILQKVKSTKKKFGMRNLATVTYEALQYLEETPCKTQTRESIINYVKDLSSYRLKSHEVLQMINDPPTSALHTQLLIDDNKAPLTDEENEKIIQLSHKHFNGSEIKETKEAPQSEAAAKQVKSVSKPAPPAPVASEAGAAISSEAETPASVHTSPAEDSNPESSESTRSGAEANPIEAEANPATAAETSTATEAESTNT